MKNETTETINIDECLETIRRADDWDAQALIGYLDGVIQFSALYDCSFAILIDALQQLLTLSGAKRKLDD